MKPWIMAILLLMGFSFFILGCDGSDSASEGIIPLEAFEPTSINTLKWMDKLDDNRRLNEIVLPGSHDSGMSECVDCSSPEGITCDFAKTQVWDIEHQLHAGTRYFDIRLGFTTGTIVRTYHRKGSGDGCDGESFPHLMEGAARFLLLCPSEFVIFKFSHWRDTPKYYPDATKAVVDVLLTAWDEFFKEISGGRELLYKKPVTIDENILSTPVSELRGKIVAVFENYAIPGKSLYDPSTGRFFYVDIGPAPSKKEAWKKWNFPVYDEYSETSNYGQMKRNQLNKLAAFGGMNKSYLFVLSWTLTPDWTHWSAIDLAKTANNQLYKVLILRYA